MREYQFLSILYSNLKSDLRPMTEPIKPTTDAEPSDVGVDPHIEDHKKPSQSSQTRHWLDSLATWTGKTASTIIDALSNKDSAFRQGLSQAGTAFKAETVRSWEQFRQQDLSAKAWTLAGASLTASCVASLASRLTRSNNPTQGPIHVHFENPSDLFSSNRTWTSLSGLRPKTF